jgi:hypothetical protein
MGKILEHHHDLYTVERYCIDQLQKGVFQKNHPFREMVLTTAWQHEPDARLVICRKVERAPFNLEAYSDQRTAKVKAIRDNPRATLLFWHPKGKFQLKIKAAVSMHCCDEVALAAWKGVTAEGRASYNSVVAPGTGYPGVAWQKAALNDELKSEEFVVVRCKVQYMEALQLSRAGHIRAGFSYENDSLLSANFLVP